MIMLTLLLAAVMGGGIGHVKRHHVDLSWTEADSGVEFRVYRGFSPGTEGMYASGIDVYSYRDTDVSKGDTYYYYVTAVSLTDGSESSPSNEVVAVVPSP